MLKIFIGTTRTTLILIVHRGFIRLSFVAAINYENICKTKLFRFILVDLITRSIQVISEADDEVIQSCLKPSDEQEDTDYSAPSTKAPPIDLYQVKDHLVKVFGHLLSREELINGKAHVHCPFQQLNC